MENIGRTEGNKHCPVCKHDKELGAFRFIKTTGRYFGYCKECEREKKRQAKQRKAPDAPAPVVQPEPQREMPVEGDAAQVMARFRDYFPQGVLPMSVVIQWFRRASFDMVMAALDDANTMAKYRTGGSVANYVGKIVESYAKGERSVTKPQRQTFNNQTQELEPVTERDRERWAAIERHLAEHGSPWPDWGDDE